MAQVLCPECRADLSNATAEELRGHIFEHWPEDMPKQADNTEAHRRRRQLRLHLAEVDQAELAARVKRGKALPEDEDED